MVRAWDPSGNRASTPSHRLYFCFAICFIVGFPLSSPALAQTVTQCQENEVLLEIQLSYQPTDINEEYLDISIQGPRVPNSGANQSSIGIFSYTQRLIDNGTIVTDNNISLCVPDDQCLQVVAKLFPVYDNYGYILPPDEVSISYNGQNWTDNKGPLEYSSGTMIVAELGPCEVVCESDEALLEIEAVTGFNPEYDWQILDDATGQIIEHCPGPFQNSSMCYWESEQYYHERLCLPRGGCYTLLVGEQYVDVYQFEAKSLHVYFDGKHIESFEYLQFINVALNDGSTVCDATYCDPGSTLVELYFFQDGVDTGENRNVTWSLSSVDGTQLPGDLGSGIVGSDRALHYLKECIPKVGPCLQLLTSLSADASNSDSSPPGNFNATDLDKGDYQENITYRLALEGIIYTDHYFSFGYSDDSVKGSFEFANYAGDCSSSRICGNSSEFHVLQLDILTEPAWQTPTINFQLLSGTDVAGHSLVFSLWPFYPDQKYRFFACIDQSWILLNNTDPEYCTAFASNDAEFWDGNGSYNISVDGVPIAGQQTTGTGVTRLAGQCEAGASEGPRVGGTVGSGFAALLAIVGGGAYFRKRARSDHSSPSRTASSPEATGIAIPIVDGRYPPEAATSSALATHDIEDNQSRPNDNVVRESEHEAQA